MLSDVIFHGKAFHLLYLLGSVLVLSGFFLVNWNYRAEQQQAESAAAAARASDTAKLVDLAPETHMPLPSADQEIYSIVDESDPVFTGEEAV